MKRIRNDVSRRAVPFIKLMKAVYHSAGASANVTLDELKRHRNFIEAIARIAFSHTRIRFSKFTIGDMPAEWISPYYGNLGRRIILYCHGGGYVCGGLEYAGVLGTKLAAHTGLDVLTFAYRLAPEHKYPAPLEDALEAWKYLKDIGIRASHIIVAGDSAGGNLALELCLHLKNKGEKQPAALVLFSPWTDMSAEGYTYESEKENDPVISKIYVENARRAYLGEEETDYKNPNYSPLYGELSGLPNTLIQVGMSEVLRYDSVALAKRMKKSGVDVKLQIYKNGWHVFQQFPTLLAKQAFIKVQEFLNTIIYGR